ncbi:hypothetical protein H9P43_007002 [Blastocladiella emersonii ATCC 22665]|nr:hypothetical protein H9P43_007002 [Blastocladiella emersonii ATCC 22665]
MRSFATLLLTLALAAFVSADHPGEMGAHAEAPGSGSGSGSTTSTPAVGNGGSRTTTSLSGARATATTGTANRASATGTPSLGNMVKLRMPKFTLVPPVKDAPKAKNCVADKSVCITVADYGDVVDIMAEGPETAKWIGVGFGTQMAGSDIVLGYVKDGTFIVSDRKATNGKGAPSVDENQDALPVGGGKNATTKKWVSHFQRPKKTGDANDVDIDLNQPLNLVWAYHDSVAVDFAANAAAPNPEFRGKVVQHSQRGKLIVDLKNKEQTDMAKSVTNSVNGATADPAKAAAGVGAAIHVATTLAAALVAVAGLVL